MVIISEGMEVPRMLISEAGDLVRGVDRRLGDCAIYLTVDVANPPCG